MVVQVGQAGSVCVKCPKDRRQQEKSDQNSVMVCRLYENEVQVTTTAKK